jgi:hypothetical protein
MSSSANHGAHRHVFIGGLHRSGTSLMSELVGLHPDASELHSTGVPEDEGQHIQDVYPAASRHGGPGRFALAHAAHLTETSDLVTTDAAERLWQAWSPYWDLSKPVLIEKSPPNMLMGRFLQALFPGAAFIMMIRHPVAVAGATRKWSHRTTNALIGHWVRAYETMATDLPLLERVLVVRYEDLVRAPEEVMVGIFSFLDLEPASIHRPIRIGINEKYFERWSRSGPHAYMTRRRAESNFADDLQRFGYQLDKPTPAGPLPPYLPQLELRS